MPRTLAPCPRSPNCVSSLPGTPRDKRVAPLTITGTADRTLKHIDAIVARWPGSARFAAEPGYRHYTITTRWLRFTDDLELLVQNGEIHLRAGSRVGWSDLGINRARVEALRVALAR